MRKRISSELRTTAMFKCVLTLNNGLHQIVRLTVDKVTKFFAAMQELRQNPWLRKRYEEFFKEIGVNYRNVRHCKFVNERTGDVLIEI